MKVIDLLNKIANGEEVPKKIKFYGNYYIWYDNRYTGNEGYCLEPVRSDSNSFLEINTVYDLNYEVEIAEEPEEKKIPEKLENEHEFYSYAEYEENKNEIDKVLYILKAINLVEEKIGHLNNSINEIIDYLKNKGE